jgi:branched-chain amino acid transport system ATP-binding protein
LGANGAGKSTTLKAISGLLHTERGQVTKGSIELEGKLINHIRPNRIFKMGIVHVVEGRQVLQHMTVEQNLIVATHLRKDRDAVARDRELVYEYFPKIRDLRGKTAGYLSGGEQQMLVIGRSMMARPRIMLLDEPSMGLAPMIVQHIFDILLQVNEQQRITLLLVEQNVPMALSIAQYGYILVNGQMGLHGATDDLRENRNIKEFYLGLEQRRRRERT